MAKAKPQKDLDRWTKQKWRTPSGKKSSETGEVYAPSKTISKLKSTAAGRKRSSFNWDNLITSRLTSNFVVDHRPRRVDADLQQ